MNLLVCFNGKKFYWISDIVAYLVNLISQLYQIVILKYFLQAIIYAINIAAEYNLIGTLQVFFPNSIVYICIEILELDLKH